MDILKKSSSSENYPLNVRLKQFEGPLELLQMLVNKQEIDIQVLRVQEILDQILTQLTPSEAYLDYGAESINYAAHLICLKSRSLLPKSYQEEFVAEENFELQVSLMEKLIEYCRFKEAAKNLSIKEERSLETYLRQLTPNETQKKPLGIEHITLTEFASLFQEILKKASHYTGIIEEEEFKIADKIKFIRKQILDYNKIDFNILFSSNHSKLELITIFLAILELMKLGEVKLIRDDEMLYLTS